MPTAPDLILPITEVKQRLLNLLKKVHEQNATITITKNGVPTGVLMGTKEYESLWETLEILADQKLLRSLARSRKEATAGKFHTDQEVWD